MTGRSTTFQAFVDSRLDAALTRAGLEHGHAVRAVLDAEAEIEGVREPTVRCQGKSLDDRIAELRHDPRFAGTFPQPVCKVSKGDMASLRAQFQKVATGEVVVE
jgi:hypothetical protein